MLQINNLSKSYGDRLLFEDVNFNLNKNEKMGLIGRNGHGKSTLLKIIVGEEFPSNGKVSLPKNYQIGYLSQHLNFTCDTVLNECLTVLDNNEDLSYKVYEFLDNLGFTSKDYLKNPHDFSGGQQLRIHLAKTILKDSNLLILDEPTNYLDISSLHWLGNYLKNLKREMIIISHNKSFLNLVCDSIGGIHYKKFKKIFGTTSKYYEQLKQEVEVLENAKKNQDKKIKHMQEFVDRFKAKASGATQAQSKLKAINKLEDIELLTDEDFIDFKFNYEKINSKVLTQINDLSFHYKEKPILFSNLKQTIRPSDRIGIIGKNGKGKSTLLNLLAGNLLPTQGEIKNHSNLKIGYFGQTNIEMLCPNSTIFEEISSANLDLEPTKIRNICGSLLFSNDLADKKISLLSGGEKSRVLLGKILAKKCNLLLLDEPNNHLDMESIEILIKELNKFEGALLIVCHDSDILKEVCNKFIIFEQDNAFEFLGSFDDYLNKYILNQVSSDQNENKNQVSPPKSDHQLEREKLKEVQKEIRKTKRDYEEIEKNIIKHEENQKSLESQMNSPEIAQEELLKISSLWENNKKLIDENYNQLEIISEKLLELEELL